MRRLDGLLLLGALLPAMAAGRLSAQVTAGIISGTITDSADAHPVAGATVLVQGTLLSATTSTSGQFRLWPVPSGPQRLRVVAIGYRSVEVAATGVDGGTSIANVALARAVVELPGIVVTASRGAERQGESPASVAVISSRELVDRNVTTLDQALPFVPGVTINNGDLAIRGSTGIANGVGSRVLVLLDGHYALTGDGGETDFEAVPLLDVERVEVVKGAYSALYGSNALGGVVNLITSPIGDRPETILRAHFGVYQVPSRYKFSDDLLSAQGFGIQHSRQVGGIGVRLFAARETSDGYTDNNGSRRWLLRAKLASAAGAEHPWDAYAIWAREIDYDFFAWRSDTLPFQVDTASRGDNERAYKFLTGATFTPLVRAHTLVRISPYLNYNTLQNDFRANDNFHNATRLGGSAQIVVTPVERSALTLGVDGSHTRVSSNFLGNRTLNDAALFGQYDVRFSRWARAVVGARLDYHKSTDGAREVQLSPKLGLVATPNEDLSLRASVGRGYRAPSAIEQFVKTSQFGFQVVPNPGLKGEHAWNGELGVTATRGRVWFDASVFQSDYRELISPGPVLGTFGVFQFQNLDRARIRGLDSGVRLRLVHGLVDVQGTYLYLDSRDLARGTDLPYRSRHNLTGTADILGGLVGVDLRYRSRPREVLVRPLDPRGAITVVDLRLGYRLLGTGLQLKVSNLFQAQYVNVQEQVPGAPRNFSLTAYRGL